MAKRITKKRVYKKRTTRPRRAARKARNQPEHASMSCTRSMNASQVNNIYSLLNTQLSDFPRAVTVAQGYQMYRITNIKLRVKSSWDTFQNTGNAYAKPFFYYMLDKSGSVPTNVALEGLKQMGAKPRALDEKTLTVSWRPTVLQSTGNNISAGGTSLSTVKRAPWLTTNRTPQVPTWTPNDVDHLGIYWGAFAALVGQADPITYEVECEVQFEFKAPLVHTPVGSATAINATFAEPNASIDGIVGGPDGQ